MPYTNAHDYANSYRYTACDSHTNAKSNSYRYTTCDSHTNAKSNSYTFA